MNEEDHTDELRTFLRDWAVNRKDIDARIARSDDQFRLLVGHVYDQPDGLRNPVTVNEAIRLTRVGRNKWFRAAPTPEKN